MTVASPPSDDLDVMFSRQPCAVTKALNQLDAPIARLSKRLAAHEPVTIVALGSSSTAGAGASSPDFSYPSRLGRELKQRFPGEDVAVINLGKNGEEAPQMITRMDQALARNPDLVLWQVGTNGVLRDKNVADVGTTLEAGIQRIKDSGADVLLIDPQFSPVVNTKPGIDAMVALIGWVAKRTNIPLFSRYAAMKHWNEEQAIPYYQFIKADGIHMNDWGYSCFARLLAEDISNAIVRSRAVADVKPPLQ